MREGTEDEPRPGERRVVVRDEGQFSAGDARALTAALVGRGKRQLHPRVAEEETAQLATGVPARAENPDRNFMHRECI